PGASRPARLGGDEAGKAADQQPLSNHPGRCPAALRGGPLSRAPLLGREAYPLWREIATRWADNDAYGHVNNVVHYSWFDTVVNGWLMSATGVDIRELDAIGVVAETGCRYLAELSFPQAVEVGIAVQRLGRTSVKIGRASGR